MSPLKLQNASPHDILTAWQNGKIEYREAMALTACENLFELYQACRSSGVPIRTNLTPAEMEGVNAAVSSFQAIAVK